MSLRLYVTGRLDIEQDGVLLDTRGIPGRQGRRMLAYLLCERGRLVPRDELAEAIWGEEPPRAWDAALSALASKLRTLLRALGPRQAARLESAYGCYRLRLAADAWVDLEAATRAIDEAEGALRGGAVAQAWPAACVASAIARRPFLPGEEGAWVERQRQRLRTLLLRALDCLAEIWLLRSEGALAVAAAQETVALEPFRETGYQRLMRAHATVGNRAEALRVYERCRRLLADELGADPSPQTQALHLELLRLE